MRILLIINVVQSLNLLIFVWLNRAAVLRILVFHQQLTVHMRKSKEPVLKSRDRLFWSSVSKIWSDWASELLLVRPETVIL